MDFNQRLQEVFDKGISVSKDILQKAKEKAQELGEKGLLKLEIKHLEDQASQLLGRLGVETYNAFVSGKKTLSRTATIESLINEIEKIKKLIDEKEKKLESLSKGTP
ncbi:MAG: hypothetical protein SNJ78_06790 [Spirochaetales bacterium]